MDQLCRRREQLVYRFHERLGSICCHWKRRKQAPGLLELGPQWLRDHEEASVQHGFHQEDERKVQVVNKMTAIVAQSGY